MHKRLAETYNYKHMDSCTCVYRTIRENGGWDCFKIQVLEEGIYNDRSLCNQREASLIREYEAKLNKCIPCA